MTVAEGKDEDSVRDRGMEPHRLGGVRLDPMSDQTGTIVVIEDDPHIADLVDLYLRKDGFRVLLAETETRASPSSRGNPRYSSSSMSAFPAGGRVRHLPEIRANDNIPVLFLTALDDEVDRILGLELGADDYLVKPFSPRELVARVRPFFAEPEKPPARKRMFRSVIWRSTSDAGKYSVAESWLP